MSSNNQFDLIDPIHLIPGKLKAAAAGSLFVALPQELGDCEIPYLAGQLGETPVLVALRGADAPFQVRPVPSWQERSGYSIRDFRLEVDRGMVVRRFEERDCRPGEVIRHDSGISIVVNDGHSNYFVDLSGDPLESSSRPTLLAFSRWELVIGKGPERHVLYHYTGRELLFGEFDPDVDEEA